MHVVYKSKLPSEIFSFDISKDGNNYALGLNDCSIVIKSKVKDQEDAEQPNSALNAEDQMIAHFMPKQTPTSKNYKYFNRGQYSIIMPDVQDLTAYKSRVQKLQPYEQHLKHFQYKQALNKALVTQSANSNAADN